MAKARIYKLFFIIWTLWYLKPYFWNYFIKLLNYFNWCFAKNLIYELILNRESLKTLILLLVFKMAFIKSMNYFLKMYDYGKKLLSIFFKIIFLENQIVKS